MPFHIKKSKARSRDGLLIVGPNQFTLLKALLHAPGNRFDSLCVWYRSEGVVGGSRESRRQSCWRVIREGWAVARWHDGGWQCSLTPEGRDIAEGKTRVLVIGPTIPNQDFDPHEEPRLNREGGADVST
jgi:hypothetical protein